VGEQEASRPLEVLDLGTIDLHGRARARAGRS
jgi:hypothetical protein